MKRMLFVYNPRAGKGLLRLSLSDIVDIFVKAGYDVVVYPTQAYRDAYRKITEFTEEYDLVVCSGGDGTIDDPEQYHKSPKMIHSVSSYQIRSLVQLYVGRRPIYERSWIFFGCKCLK